MPLRRLPAAPAPSKASPPPATRRGDFRPAFPLLCLGALGIACLSLASWSPPEPEGNAGSPSVAPAAPGPKGDPQMEVHSGPTEVYCRRMVPQAEVVQGLLSEQLTLRQAAARFRELSRSGPPFNWERFRRTYPGRSDEERFCRQVIAATRGTLGGGDPSFRERVLARLEGELQAYLADPGTAGFPGQRPAASRTKES